MTPVVIIYLALISISALVAGILAIAWHEFGRPRHALTWSIAFALAALMWALDLIDSPVGGPDIGTFGTPMLIVAGFASTVNTIGFRQRGGVREERGGLLAAAVVHAVLVVLLAAIGAPTAARAMPLSLFNAALFWLAATALVGRRRGERLAARAAQGGLLLLSLLNFAFLIGMGLTLAGHPSPFVANLGALTALMLPVLVTVIGLFTIILLVADLADQARRLAATDMLTGALNRRGFDEAARALIASVRRTGRSIALVVIDLDRFKAVNDRFGHPAGDRVLRAVCDCIGEGIGRRDLFARTGGEEFALIMTDVDLETARCAADVLRTQVAALDVELAEPYQVTASFGVTLLRDDDRGLGDMFRRADAALYRAKAEGRDRVVADP